MKTREGALKDLWEAIRYEGRGPVLALCQPGNTPVKQGTRALEVDGGTNGIYLYHDQVGGYRLGKRPPFGMNLVPIDTSAKRLVFQCPSDQRVQAIKAIRTAGQYHEEDDRAESPGDIGLLETKMCVEAGRTVEYPPEVLDRIEVALKQVPGVVVTGRE
jgi:hypothetical protein